MKKLIFAVLVFTSTVCFAETLFEYRGIFPANRDSNAEITNYMLLKEAKGISFEIFEPGKKEQTDRVKIQSVKLTSDSSVEFKSDAGVKRINLPETGIYEIKLIPVSRNDGEIKFILRVLESENEDDGAAPATTKIEENTKTEEKLETNTLEISSIAKDSSNNLDDNLHSTNAKLQERIDLNQASIKIDNNLTKANIASSTELEVPPSTLKIENSEIGSVSESINASYPESNIVIATLSDSLPSNIASEVIETASSTSLTNPDVEFQVVSPANRFYLNPFRGIRFKSSFKLQEDGSGITEIKVFNKMVDGSEKAVKGNFIDLGDNLKSFTPEPITPGVVYYLKCNGDEPNNDKVFKFPSFPDLKAKYQPQKDVHQFVINWNQNYDFMANSMGQVVKLEDTKIELKTTEKTIFSAEINGNTPPFFYNNSSVFKLSPYNLLIATPKSTLSDEQGEIVLSVSAHLDGYPDYIKIFSQTFQIGEKSESNKNEIGIESLRDAPATLPENLTGNNSNLDIQEALKLDFVKSIKIEVPGIGQKAIWPHETSLDEFGNIWILDSQMKQVYCFNLEGNLRISFGQRDSDKEKLGFPYSMIYKDGIILVSDSLERKIHKFSTDGKLVGTIPGANERLVSPGGMCFRNKEVWVVDRHQKAIVCFDKQEKYLGKFGGPDTNLFSEPVMVRATDKALFVLESSGEVKIVSPMGQLETSFDSGCKGAKTFWVDKWGFVWICDGDRFQVKRFNQDGKLLTVINPPPGPKPWIPTCVSTNDNGLVAIGDAQFKKIYLFKMVGK